MNKKRFVVDTSVVVSALLFPSGKPAQVLKHVFQHHNFLLSQAVLEELEDVLYRDKFKSYITLDKIEQFFFDLLDSSEIVVVMEFIQECDDPKDDKFLELAVTGKADGIITSDDDLLRMNPFRNIPILTVRQALESF